MTTRSGNSALFGVVRESADRALSLAASAILIFGPLPIAGSHKPEPKIQAPRSTILAIERSNARYIPHLEFNAGMLPGTPAPGSETRTDSRTVARVLGTTKLGGVPSTGACLPSWIQCAAKRRESSSRTRLRGPGLGPRAMARGAHALILAQVQRLLVPQVVAKLVDHRH